MFYADLGSCSIHGTIGNGHGSIVSAPKNWMKLLDGVRLIIRIDQWARSLGAELLQHTAPKAGLASTTIAGLATERAVAAQGKSEVEAVAFGDHSLAGGEA